MLLICIRDIRTFYKNKLKSKVKLHVTSVIMMTYPGEIFEVLGEITVNVKYPAQIKTFNVVKGKGPVLLGRNWLQIKKLNWQSVHIVMTYDLKQYSVLTSNKGAF